jgi:hypothetical protein
LFEVDRDLNRPGPHETVEDAPEELLPEASRTFKQVQLRLLMKEREELFSRLVGLDYNIWVLEEFFRVNNPMLDPLSIIGTTVPKGSLSHQGGTPTP